MFLGAEIETCLRKEGEARALLQDAVTAFRNGLGRGESSSVILSLAHEVHYALEGLRSIEAALGHLRSARDAFRSDTDEEDTEVGANRPTPRVMQVSGLSARSL